MAKLLFILAALIGLVAVVVKLVVQPRLVWPVDPAIGQLAKLSEEELRSHYQDKRVLVIGGTRGVGLGVALVTAGAGAHVTVVGRNPQNGELALEQLRATGGSGSMQFVQGDLGSVADSKELVEKLAQATASQADPPGFDYLVVTAATFPDWSRSQTQQDGLNLPFAIAVVGRYIVYQNMDHFMKNASSVRVMNVLAPGMHVPILAKDMAEGKRDAKNLAECILTFGNANDIMFQNLEMNATRVNTHPGVIMTDLFHGQGWWFGIIAHVAVALAGVSIEECGLRQASILASDKLHSGQLSYVGEHMVGLLPNEQAKSFAKEHTEWVKSLLTRVVG